MDVDLIISGRSISTTSAPTLLSFPSLLLLLLPLFVVLALLSLPFLNEDVISPNVEPNVVEEDLNAL